MLEFRALGCGYRSSRVIQAGCKILSGSIIHELQRISQSSLGCSIRWYIRQTSGGSCAQLPSKEAPQLLALKSHVTCDHHHPSIRPRPPATDRRHHAATLQVETPAELNVSHLIHLIIYFLLSLTVNLTPSSPLMTNNFI